MRFKSKWRLLALVAVFAMSAVAVSAASAALPEFKPVPTKKKFTSSSGESVWRAVSQADVITCSKSTTSGEVTGTGTIGKTVIKFTGCSFEEGSVGPCPVKSTNTTNEGEIVTDPLKGELGTVKTSQAPSGVGMLLQGEANSEILTLAGAKSGCKWEEVTFEGSIAGEVATVGKKQLTNAFVFAPVSLTGNQKISEITVKGGTAKPKLKTWGTEVMSLEWSDATTFEEALEVTS